MKKMKISKKKTAATAFAVFFLVMAVCTAVSRAAASMVVPTVTTGRVQEGKLNISIRGNGTVETRSERTAARTACGNGTAGRIGCKAGRRDPAV